MLYNCVYWLELFLKWAMWPMGCLFFLSPLCMYSKYIKLLILLWHCNFEFWWPWLIFLFRNNLIQLNLNNISDESQVVSTHDLCHVVFFLFFFFLVCGCKSKLTGARWVGGGWSIIIFSWNIPVLNKHFADKAKSVSLTNDVNSLKTWHSQYTWKCISVMIKKPFLTVNTGIFFLPVISFLIEVISFFPPENTRSESFIKEYEAVWI